MKRIVVVLFCVLICQVLSAQVELGHQEKYYVIFPYNIQPSELDINCKISQVKYTNYELVYKYGEFERGRQIGYVLYQYNTNNQLSSLYREGDGWDGWHSSSKYNWQLQYDGNGHIVSNNYVYENGKLSKVTYYDDVIRMYYTNGILNKVIKYAYDGEESYTVYYQNGDAIKKVIPPRPWNQNKTETNTYYYSNHKLTKGEGFTYTYNAKGLVSKMVYRHSKIVNEYAFITGSGGQGTKVVEDIYEYTYEYDSKGNWIKRTCTQKDEYGYIKKGVLTEREITYRSGNSTSQNTGSKTTSSATEQNTGSSNTRCDALLTSFMEYCNHKDWDEAYNPWTVLFKECPECSEYMYIYGEAFVKQQINLVDISERGPWVDTLMMIYDQRIKYFAAKSKIYDEGYLLGRKGFDLFRYRGILRRKEAYDILRKSIDLKGEKSEADVIWCAARASLILYRNNQINLSELTNNYEQYKKLLPLIDCTESEREQVSNELSCMASDINR